MFKISDKYDQSINSVRFSSEEDDWRMWMAQFLAMADHKGYADVLDKMGICLPGSEVLTAGKDDNRR